MYGIYYTNEFKKQLKLMLKRGKNAGVMNNAIEILGNTGTLPIAPYRTHKLSGNLAGHWEAHLESDWLLVWKIDKNKIIIILTNTGTHSDLF
ncbi:MAG: type II toxin-antitoxin system YafQ family toxin [Prevotellaceae bacterium]|jgi:mRNA interferase YafQ|nr:type II toxin-antitoxin system YafQ family toxin [Prevotellaceae bacterium]